MGFRKVGEEIYRGKGKSWRGEGWGEDIFKRVITCSTDGFLYGLGMHLIFESQLSLFN